MLPISLRLQSLRLQDYAHQLDAFGDLFLFHSRNGSKPDKLPSQTGSANFISIAMTTLDCG
jgi:hypothetical protein